MKEFKYIYGPVSSWRLGSSLGIDLISQKMKICTFNCVYCQLGERVLYTNERKIYVETDAVINELKEFPDIEIDYITFSGIGEPTLAKNLLETADAIRSVRDEKIAILTNSSLMVDDEVKRELKEFDFVIAKLDAVDQENFLRINRPMYGIEIDKIINSIVDFKTDFNGKLALQIMFIEENEEQADRIADIVAKIQPDEVQINTPLRPCGVKPLDRKSIAKISKYFERLEVITVYESKKKKVIPISKKETMERRGKVL